MTANGLRENISRKARAVLERIAEERNAAREKAGPLGGLLIGGRMGRQSRAALVPQVDQLESVSNSFITRWPKLVGVTDSTY